MPRSRTVVVLAALLIGGRGRDIPPFPFAQWSGCYPLALPAKSSRPGVLLQRKAERVAGTGGECGADTKRSRGRGEVSGDPAESEPGDVAFAMDTPGRVEFTALEGRVGMSGDYGFGM